MKTKTAMSQCKAVTGINITSRVAMESADLGIMRWDDQRKAIAAMFGDNFEFWRMQGEWQSPSIVMYDNDFDVLGVPTKEGIDPNGRRKQLWEYPHNNSNYSTILPCDFIRIKDVWYVACMVTAGLGNEKRTVFWRSHDLYDWEKTEPYVYIDHTRAGSHPGIVMLTFDQYDNWVYIFGTGGLSRNKSIWLWRCSVDKFPYFYNWEILNNGDPILVGKYGELCFRVIQGQCVLSFFDADRYCQTALTVVQPTDDWKCANSVDYAFGQEFPQLYGGYISPNSELNKPGGMKFFVSQWNTAGNDPYHVVLFEDTLQSKGPLIIEQPVKEEPPVSTSNAQQLYELLLRELSASGSVKITTPDGKNITLREAVEQIFNKERGLYGLENRPRYPTMTDDQLGHVLNTRTEGLLTQALVCAIADKLGVDSATVYAKARESIS